MSIRVAIKHTTRYDYERLIELGPQTVRLRPAPHTRTPIKGYSLRILPENHFINWQQDPFGNYLARLVFPEKVKTFEVAVEVIADMVVINPFDFFIEDFATHFPFSYPPDVKKELSPYLEIIEQGPELQKWIAEAQSFKTQDITTIDFVVALNQALNRQINYRIRMEPGVQTCQETLTSGSGSCRDSAWLLVQILRHFGLAARFTSGYLVQLKSDQKSLEGPSGPEEDFTDLHAWTEVYIPGAGWIGLDPTSGLFASEGHIPLACTPSPQSAAPISGVIEACKTDFFFENKVTRLKEKPRVTKPYTDQQWQSILEVGNKVEDELIANQVHLTMGGEPTFVSVENQDAAEWNTAADGDHKRKVANDLFLGLKESFAPGGLLHYGQGKWYPGEPLPRWKFACYWRRDGEPMWKNKALFADPNKKYQLTPEDGERFLQALTGKLQVDANDILPAYEDPIYFIWEEQKIPVDIDPMSIDLESKLERQKLAELLSRGMSNPVAHVIPLQWEKESHCWQSCRWTFRRNNLFLIPGNSAAGMRLPLDAIKKSEVEETDDIYLDKKDPFSPDNPLPGYNELTIDHPGKKTARGKKTIFTTTLVIEIRDEKLYVFIPPLVRMEHYLRLIAAIEETAEKLSMPLIIEGYDPPSDNRMQKFMVTPDPGVIEVNIQPCKSWEELLHVYDVLFEKARECKLTTEKFNLDGKHTGTGGGNHVTLGGDKPSQSPLLRRPDLLRSLITYWQHHPSLSYLFSTQFIGPTSQAPRVDEGRDEILYELELAFQQIPDNLAEDQVPYWLVDRLFRNLLIDVTGNTHRAEFCIDKLYSPDSSSGRLGILEFRGFDMPPHKQMCMVQLLLIRALVSRFWQNPYKKKLVRWGTNLHDRFLLPHYCYQDLSEVISELNEAGYGFDIDWFDPFFSFRFPFLGEIQANDVHIELRMAIEPWHVLGEEISSTGTARFVDSSLERIQVAISGLTDGRYQLLCNGCRIPLQKTATQGSYVAGIRYRAWQPPSALHPTLGVDTPLVFDLYDTWSDKSVAACKYHVSHPGGRNYDTFPVNSFEAEGRRTSRFFDFGHTINLVEPTLITPAAGGRFVTRINNPAKKIKINQLNSHEYPHTMDLRRYKGMPL
ncbi:MAG: transglutaminase family protein [Saprospiraceae bacterium]|nr:transglutaminase family protein [Saprospiraceae bacterium]